MATQKVFFECSFCKRLYDEEGQATACEGHHAELSELKVIDGIDVDDRSGEYFPGKILLKHSEHDGQLAEYTLSRKGEVEEFYQAAQQWHKV